MKRFLALLAVLVFSVSVASAAEFVGPPKPAPKVDNTVKAPAKAAPAPKAKKAKKVKKAKPAPKAVADNTVKAPAAPVVKK